MAVKIALVGETKGNLVLFLIRKLYYVYLHINIHIYKEGHCKLQKYNLACLDDSNKDFIENVRPISIQNEIYVSFQQEQMMSHTCIINK